MWCLEHERQCFIGFKIQGDMSPSVLGRLKCVVWVVWMTSKVNHLMSNTSATVGDHSTDANWLWNMYCTCKDGCYFDYSLELFQVLWPFLWLYCDHFWNFVFWKVNLHIIHAVTDRDVPDTTVPDTTLPDTGFNRIAIYRIPDIPDTG